MKTASLTLRSALVSLLMLIFFVGAWQLASSGPSVGGSSAGMTAEEIEYAKMMGKDPGASKSTGFPPPVEVGKAIITHLSDPFYQNARKAPAFRPGMNSACSKAAHRFLN